MKCGKKLKFGDTIGLIAPSGVLRQSDALELAVKETERMGFRVKLGDSAGQKYGYLSGYDNVRANDINQMFADDEVDAIVCLRGGYGATRILDQLDYAMIASHPKIFMGFSDITALHIAFQQACRLVTFHGPMAAANWANHPLDEFTLNAMYRLLMQAVPAGELQNPDGYEKTTITSGCAEGILTGGNLSLIAASLGTPWEIDTKGKILFIEEIGERTYCIDRMLTQLRLAGKFKDCAGIVFGDFADCTVEYPTFGLTLEEVIRDIVVPCGKPIFSGLRCGHCSPNLTLPLGAKCHINADTCTLTVLESAVEN